MTNIKRTAVIVASVLLLSTAATAQTTVTHHSSGITADQSSVNMRRH